LDLEYADRDFTQPAISIPTVNPERTFLEKIFLLHEEFQRPSYKRRVNRLSRHLYDIVKLANAGYLDISLESPDLYQTIVTHRSKFNIVGGVNYNLHTPQTLNPLPPDDVIDAWKSDYETMLEQMIYEQNPPSFEYIIKELTALKDKINALPWSISKIS
jgi:hypothetical protein